MVFMEREISLFWYPIEKRSFILYIIWTSLSFFFNYDKASVKELWILKHALNQRNGEICAFYRRLRKWLQFTAIIYSTYNITIVG